MKVYFVRHGQTKYNLLKLHQPDDAKLSDLGIKQAETLAKRFSKIPIDIIYSSPLERARQTVGIINKSLGKKVVYLDSLRERKGPSEFLGERTDSQNVFEINKIRNLHEKDRSWHYSDEENFIEFKERVKKFFNILSGTKEENVLVLSHGGLIKMTIYLMMGDDFTANDFYKFSSLFKMKNTGITFCERNKKGIWSVLAFNDHSHLG